MKIKKNNVITDSYLRIELENGSFVTTNYITSILKDSKAMPSDHLRLKFNIDSPSGILSNKIDLDLNLRVEEFRDLGILINEVIKSINGGS
jgi:hypothetical protein